ncbi:MAG: alpha/beta fold hydrolase [Geobacter sp.]|nr:alpha/beta fold hydrolase [Geobacter sp.]
MFLTTSDGIMLHYEDKGQGRPLVFVHGWAMSGRVWFFQTEELASSHRVVTLDLRGHGRSEPSSGPFSMSLLAADLRGLMDGLALENAIVVGWSMGVQVVLEAFPSIRERVAGLVLVSGTPRFTSAADYLHALPPVEARGMGVRLKRNFAATMGDFFRRMFVEGELDHDRYQRIVREVVIGGRQPSPETALDALRALQEADQRQCLPEIDVPVLLVHGDLDTICLPAASRYMTGQLSHARLEMMEGVGHAPFMSRPGEFNHMLMDFTRSLDAA